MLGFLLLIPVSVIWSIAWVSKRLAAQFAVFDSSGQTLGGDWHETTESADSQRDDMIDFDGWE